MGNEFDVSVKDDLAMFDIDGYTIASISGDYKSDSKPTEEIMKIEYGT